MVFALLLLLLVVVLVVVVVAVAVVIPHRAGQPGICISIVFVLAESRQT